MNIARILFWTVPIFIINGLRLLLFVVALTPGFVCFAWYYFVTAARTSVAYDTQSVRQTLDIYQPYNGKQRQRHGECINDSTNTQIDTNDESAEQQECLLQETEDNDIPIPRPPPAPVLVFYTGGGWMIGYKMWGSLLARALTAAGILVVIPDMRNYPFDTVPGMVQDVNQSLQWTMDHIAEYGGDPRNMVVVGQSAGGHVVCMAILEKLREQWMGDDFQDEHPTTHESPTTSWLPTDLKGLVTISAPFNLQAMSASFERKGLDENLVNRIFGNEMERYDPFQALHRLQQHENDNARNSSNAQSLQELLPPIRIYHGSADMTVPHESSETFYRELQKSIPNPTKLSFVSYPGWSHTDPILEGPMSADQTLHRDLFNDLVTWTENGPSTLTWPADDPIIKDRLCPSFMVSTARFVMPF